MRGETWSMKYLVISPGISTHSPHAGRDRSLTHEGLPLAKFQPTLPMRGETSASCSVAYSVKKFQPTLPMRGETIKKDDEERINAISTHSPHAGRDLPK